MSESLYQIRKYGEKVGDYQLIDEWWRVHNDGQFLENLLPPDGFIVERDGDPVCAAWLYLSAGIGVAFMEWIVSKPGQSLSQSKEAFFQMVEFIKGYARASDYGVVWCNTLPAIARVAVQCGFRVAGKERVAMVLTTNQ